MPDNQSQTPPTPSTEIVKSSCKRVSDVWNRIKPSVLLSKAFGFHGVMVARYPWVYIVFCLALAGAFGSGIRHIHWETNVVRLWNPQNSETAENFRWLWRNHPPNLRRHQIIFKGNNVLTKAFIEKMFAVREKLYNFVTTSEYKWNQVCLKVPIVPAALAGFISPSNVDENENDGFSDDDGFFDDDDKAFAQKDPTVNLYPDPLCKMYNSLKFSCLEDSLLELFGLDGTITRDQISNLTDAKILEAINEKTMSGMYSFDKDFKSMLGKVEYDEMGKIVGAKVTSMVLYGKMNATESHLNGSHQDLLGDQISIEKLDKATDEVESELIAVLMEERNEKYNALNPKGFSLEANVQKSFQDAVNQRILGDIPKIIGSFGIMFLYISLNLGNFDLLHNRIYLSQVGLLAVLLAMLTSYGLCSYLGFLMSPLHNFIPFLLLGLGVDDMFVIIRAFDFYTKPPSSHSQPKSNSEIVASRISEALKHSGVAITVTSLTDFLAFAVGGTTSIPALKSFCFFCGIGIICVYFYQSTLFVACLALDERRKLANRNALLPCIKVAPKNDQEQNKSCCTFPTFCNLNLLEKYGRLLTKRMTQILIITLALAVFGLSIYGNIELKQEFDPWLFLPEDDPVRIWRDSHRESFPSKGEHVLLISEGGDAPLNLTKIGTMVHELQAQDDIVNEIKSWIADFEIYYRDNFESDLGPLSNLPWQTVRQRLGQFLYSPFGMRYKYLFDFEQDFECGKELPVIGTHIIELTHVKLVDSNAGIKAMNRVKDVISKQEFSRKAFAFSPMYSVLEIDEIIRRELYRNLGFASAAIYVATLLLLSDFIASLFCLMSVFVTLANVSGMMYFWGLTIDTVTCTVLIVCIGLSVDFSAHMVHAFMTTPGPAVSTDLSGYQKRSHRMRLSLSAIAPAILHGGLSTLLAVVLLAFSEVYVFVAFFKIFILVVFFGLYNGLVLLPIFLSLCGPNYKGQNDVIPHQDRPRSSQSSIYPTAEQEELQELSPKKNIQPQS